MKYCKICKSIILEGKCTSESCGKDLKYFIEKEIENMKDENKGRNPYKRKRRK